MNTKMKKILVMFILIIAYIVLALVLENKVFAINQTTTTDINSIDSNKYPKIKEVLIQLKNEHPNWNFKILYTDIDWKEAVANEYTGHGVSPRNLVPANNSNYGGEWICKVCGNNKLYDSGWYCASEEAISYMMDPRNSTNNSDIFQFMELSYSDCDMQTVRTMVKNTFLDNESYINAIVTSTQKYNVNVYYTIARLLQEQGNSGSVLSSGEGYNGLYVGYYNAFNIGASGNGKETVILNGLKRAQTEGWTTLESSIDGGLQIISAQYIQRGQNTMYFQKFDVENSDGNLYWHQYMQNILAAQSEGSTLRKTFESVVTKGVSYTFIIPLYKNMTSVACSRPSTTSSTIPTNTDLVKVNVNNSLRLRNEPNGSQTVGWIYKDEIVTRLEKATQKENGTYWDYVMKSDGTKGYAARETYDNESTYKLYLVPIENETPNVPVEPELPNNNLDINDKIKIDTVSNKVTSIPGTTLRELKELIGDNTTVKNAKGDNIEEDDKLSTGSVVNGVYTIIVLGDVNGDGEVNTIDAARTLKASVGNYQFEGVYFAASDINGDGEINTVDAARMLRAAVGNYKIQF